MAPRRPPTPIRQSVPRSSPATTAQNLGPRGLLRVGQDDDVLEPGREQRPDPWFPRGPAHGTEQGVEIVVAPAALDHDDAVRAAQVVTESLGPVESLLAASCPRSAR